MKDKDTTTPPTRRETMKKNPFFEVWINDKFVYRYKTLADAQARLNSMAGEEKEIRETGNQPEYNRNA